MSQIKSGQLYQSANGTILEVVEPISETHARVVIVRVGTGDPFEHGGYEQFRLLGGTTEFSLVEPQPVPAFRIVTEGKANEPEPEAAELPGEVAKTLNDIVSEVIRYVGPPLWLGDDGSVVEQLAPIVNGKTTVIAHEVGSRARFPVGVELNDFYLFHPAIEITFTPVTSLELAEHKLGKARLKADELAKENHSLKAALAELIRVIERSPKLTVVEQAKAVLGITQKEAPNFR